MFRLRNFSQPSLWNAMQQFQNEMSRLFDRGGFASAPSFPALNVWEEDEAVRVEAELPGLELNDLEIFVTGQNQLTIKGRRQARFPEKATLHRQERGFGEFVRTLTLPYPVDDARVEARLENGILSIHLPKHEAARPRRIQVKS